MLTMNQSEDGLIEVESCKQDTKRFDDKSVAHFFGMVSEL